MASASPPRRCPTIFDVFSQASQARTRAQGGVGIGLSLVKGLVELHGGRVSARSPGLDQGSTFEVRLPLARGGAPRPARGGRSGRDGAARAAACWSPTTTAMAPTA